VADGWRRKKGTLVDLWAFQKQRQWRGWRPFRLAFKGESPGKIGMTKGLIFQNQARPDKQEKQTKGKKEEDNLINGK
jgi:hypothetical protein